jgi:predicted metal-dependent phosphoesterase TrpH
MPHNIDLHTHSFFSGDGISSPEDLIAAARAKGLSGIAITDHNTCDAVNYLLEKGLMRLDGMPVNDFLVLPGVEVTTADGHLLCIGAELPYLKGKPAREVCDIIHQRGGLAIPPHPYDLFRAGIRLATLSRHCPSMRSKFSMRQPHFVVTTVTLSNMRRSAVCR